MLCRSAFFRYSLSIATPIMVQNLISTLVNVADTVMLGYISQSSMAAASLAGQIQSVLFMLFFGLTAGSSVLGAQYWGKKDTQTIERILALSAAISIGIALLFLFAAEFMPRQIMRALTTDFGTIQEGIPFLRILGFSWIFTAFSQSYVSIQRCMERVVFPTAVYVVSLAANVFLNAVFIFGLFGFPMLGLKGVALATVIARFAECAMCLIHFLSAKSGRLRVRHLLFNAKILTQDLLKISIPPILNDASYSLAGSGLVALFRPLILRVYIGKLTPAALNLLGSFLLIEAARIFAEAVNTCWNCGCLRSGGDSEYGFIVDTITNWGFVIPLTALAAFWLKLSPQWVFLCMCLEEYGKLPVYFARYRNYSWMKNITRESAIAP